jgi:hypothetical protein
MSQAGLVVAGIYARHDADVRSLFLICFWAPILPCKLNLDRHHQVPRQRHGVSNSAAYAALRQRGSLTVWFTPGAVELARLGRVGWLNHPSLLGPIGNMPPAEAEARYHAELAATPMAA